MSPIRLSLIILGGIFIGACVTINVYFPAAAAEKAADQIIDQVWGAEQQKKVPPPTEEKETTSALTNRVAIFLIPVSYAQSANLDISSPTIQALKKRMTERHQHLKTYYDKGAIGLTQNGLITLRNRSQVPLKMRNAVNRWIAEENDDRLALYREIAVTNGHPDWEADIQATFASRWIERAQVGWWYQNAKGEWRQKQ